MPKGRHYLVTGGAGFIGSHLCGHLLGQGHAVTAIDNFATGSRDNVAEFSADARFKLIEADAADTASWEASVSGPDVVIHLAAAVGVQKVIDEPVWTLETNINVTDAILKFSRARGLRTLIASTSEVYGRGAQELFSENDDLLIGPSTSRRWGYAASKLVDEFLALAYFHEFNLPVTVLRLFNTVGPRQTGRYGMVIPRFVSQALKGEPITVVGDGEQRRTFTGVTQCVRAITGLVDCAASHGEVINIGGTAELSINELAGIVLRMTGGTGGTKRLSYHDIYGHDFEDMRRRNPDTSKLRRMLGWAPQETIEDILKPIIDDMRKRIGSR